MSFKVHLSQPAAVLGDCGRLWKKVDINLLILDWLTDYVIYRQPKESWRTKCSPVTILIVVILNRIICCKHFLVQSEEFFYFEIYFPFVNKKSEFYRLFGSCRFNSIRHVWNFFTYQIISNNPQINQRCKRRFLAALFCCLFIIELNIFAGWFQMFKTSNWRKLWLN